MATDYDAWLVQPYEDQAEWEAIAEQYEESEYYSEDLSGWLEENPGKTEADYRDSSSYERSVESYAEYLVDRHRY